MIEIINEKSNHIISAYNYLDNNNPYSINILTYHKIIWHSKEAFIKELYKNMTMYNAICCITSKDQENQNTQDYLVSYEYSREYILDIINRVKELELFI